MATITTAAGSGVQLQSASSLTFASDDPNTGGTAFTYSYKSAGGTLVTLRSFNGTFTYGSGTNVPPSGGLVSQIEIDADGDGSAEMFFQNFRQVATLDFDDADALYAGLFGQSDNFNLSNLSSTSFSRLFGDHRLVTGSLRGANDTMVLGTMHGLVSGDAFEVAAGASYLGGADTISGSVSTIVQSIVGDVEQVRPGAFVIGGNDRLTGGSDTGTSVVAGDFEAVNDGAIAQGGDDRITAAAAGIGDAARIGEINVGSGSTFFRGGADTIRGTTDTTLVGDILNVGQFLEADDTIVGGNDTIHVGPGGSAVGDFFFIRSGTVVTIGGNDTIHGSELSDNLDGDFSAFNSPFAITTGGDDILHGYGGADTLNGQKGDDILDGGDGKDRLDGGEGADTMIGGAGNDLFFVNSGGDVVVEEIDGGSDEIRASTSVVMADNVEFLVLVEGAGNLNGTGNAGVNDINGNSGNNTLDGGLGADIMRGGLGNDIYRVDNAGDQIFEAAGGGSDDVRVSVSFALAAGQEIEVLRVEERQSVNAINLVGNSFAQTLNGNNGKNTLNASAGNDTVSALGGDDTLHGGLGNDRLAGGLGNDSFVFDTALNAATNADTITDFANATDNDDRFLLENAIFTRLTATGNLNPAFFKANLTGTAQDSNDFVLYETDTGRLLYDADGNGAGAAVQFATLTNLAALTAADFVVI